MKEKLHRMITEVSEEMIGLRRKIHSCPEPAYEEVQTAATVVKYLRDIKGMEIKQSVGKTGVVALLGKHKKGPCVALRADMDCLRMQEENSFAYASQKAGLMHGCGHDGHIACLVGAAKVLGSMVDELQGPVKFIFQPAEENYAGASKMIADGALANPKPRAIFALHGTPSLELGKVGLCRGPMMAASKYFTITVTGAGTHAAMPHKGVDSVLAASQIVCAAHTIVSRNINPLDAALISIPMFNGSTAPNVLPNKVTLQGTLRALSTANVTFLEKRLEEVVRQTAEAYGAKAVIEFFGGYPLLENEQSCFEYLAKITAENVGEENVRCDYPPSLGSEDFAFYLEHVPGAFWWLGLANPGDANVPLHNPKFDFNDKALATGITLHCQTALNGHLL